MRIRGGNSIFRISGGNVKHRRGRTWAAGLLLRSGEANCDCKERETTSDVEGARQSRADSINGEHAVTLTFGGSFSGREKFVLKTGRDAQNAPGRSNVRDVAIF